MLLGVAVGAGLTVIGVALAFTVMAIPLFIGASTDPGGNLDRSLVRRGLFQVALPFGLVAGAAAGISVGVWYVRGGRLPTGRSPVDR